MVYIYLFSTSLLMFFISAGAAVRRDENTGIVWVVLAALTLLITIIRSANSMSKWLYKRYSGENKKLTITDLLVFDGAMYILYGIAAGFAHDVSDITAWLLMIFVGCPTLVITSCVIIGRFKSAFELKREREMSFANHDPLMENCV